MQRQDDELALPPEVDRHAELSTAAMLRHGLLICLFCCSFSGPVLASNELTVAEGVPLVNVPGFGQAASFNSVQATAFGSTQPVGSFTLGDGQWSGTGVVMNNNGHAADGLYATPVNDSHNYMAVMGGNSETVSFATLKSGIAFYWGSMDWYNSLTLYNGDQSVTIYAPAPANGDQLAGSTNRFMEVTGFDFTKAVFSSEYNSFEFDNVMTMKASVTADVLLPTSVPELSTWEMMLISFAGVGFAGYRQSKRMDTPRL